MNQQAGTHRSSNSIPQRSSTAPDDAEAAASQPRAVRSSATTDLALIASFAALIAACAIVPGINVGPAPITLQTFGVILTGAVLGSRRGLLAVLLYLAVGAIGLPVFTGGAAGLAPFAGATVGYLVAFPLAAWLTGFIVERLPRRKVAASVPLVFLAGLAANLVFIHALGPLGMAWRAGLTVPQAFAADLVFWPGDLVKTALVAVIATAVHRAFPGLLPRRRAEHTAPTGNPATGEA